MLLKRAHLQQKFGEAAGDYDALAQFQHTQTRHVLDSALMLLPKAATLLDVGSGTGYFAQAAKTLRPDWNILGLDIAFGMCALGKNRCAALNADAEQLPLADASVDGAVSSLCYQWVENQPQAFAELARVLKPSGRAIIASLGETTLHELRNCAEHAELVLGVLPMQKFSASVDALNKAGFDVTVQEKRLEVIYYPSVRALLDSMRNIGAGNHFAPSSRGFTRPKRWAAMIQYYEQLRTPKGIPATWEHHFFILSKRP